MRRGCTKLLAAVLVAACCGTVFGCAPSPAVGDTSREPIDDADAVEHGSSLSVYDKIGKRVSIDMVEESETGEARVTLDGVTYTLGMDFLSMAMVYNTRPPLGSALYRTETDVYQAWWRLYIRRWNRLLPEIPLYSNQYFDVYNAKLTGFRTSPYWGADQAIVAATVRAGEQNSATLGSTTDLTGAFRAPSWGRSSPGAADAAVGGLVSGCSTLLQAPDGEYEWNMDVLAEEPSAETHADGTLTWTLRIRGDLCFSDGSPIRAVHYVAGILAGSTVVAEAAGGIGNAGQVFLGYDAFHAYDGTNEGALLSDRAGEDRRASPRFSGVRLLGDDRFSLTLESRYAGYYYSLSHAALSPTPLALYLGTAGEVVADPSDGVCGLNDAFYKTADTAANRYVTADKIRANLAWDSPLPYSGPYTVARYDASARIATLRRNPYYRGEKYRGDAAIETLTYRKVETATATDQLEAGEIDVLEGITGGDETRAALALVRESGGRFRETHYDRAGYGKLGFRADFGPSGMQEVRQAIAHTINRPAFAQTFTGGYGSVVDGPYYTGSAAYRATRETLDLDPYTFGIGAAVARLEAGGWVYNADGEAYDPNEVDAYGNAVRYKKLTGYERSRENLHFSTVDGRYRTVKVRGAYYMPLAINWYGTASNPVTTQLTTDWFAASAPRRIGMYIQMIETDFNTAVLGELARSTADGYNGVPKLNAVNFATSFPTAVYDYAFGWTIDPNVYDTLSVSYLRDEADYAENYEAATP